MTIDPVQLLIDAGAIPQSPFDAASRYRGVAIALHPGAAGEAPLPCLRRRFIAQPREIAIAAGAVVGAADRPDLLAARAYGDALLWWRIADANAVLDADELCATPGARLAVPAATGG